jgi:SAM-dependent methyltransferase
MKRPTYRFSQRVDNYIKYRPHYPQAILDLLKAECQLANTDIIADVGSGTGILAELFLQNGNPVFGIEPDPDMRAGGEYYLQTYPNFTMIAGTAESTTLPDDAVDYLTVGQAFHWFDVQRARKEFVRILVPGGWVVLVWNIQRASGTPFLVALQQFWENKQFWKHSSRQSARQAARAQTYRLDMDLARRELLEPFFAPGNFREEVFGNPMICDFERLRGRILSNGTALEPGDPNYGAMLNALERLFETYQQNGTVTIEHDTRLVYGQLMETK